MTWRGRRKFNPRMDTVSKCCKKPFYTQTIYYSEYLDGKAKVRAIGTYRCCMGIGCAKAWKEKCDIKSAERPDDFTVALWQAMCAMENPLGRFICTRNVEGDLIPYGGQRWMVIKREPEQDLTRDWAP